MKQNILALLFALGMGSLFAENMEFDGVKAVFATEINFVKNLMKSVESCRDLSVFIDSSLVSFIRANHVQLAAEITVYIDTMVAMHKQPIVQKRFTEAIRLFKEFIVDPALARAVSGKDIVALASYQKFKAADQATRTFLKDYYKAMADKMPLLYKCIDSIQSYTDVLMSERIDKALNAIAWDMPLKDVVTLLKAESLTFDVMIEECVNILNITQLDNLFEKQVELAAPLKEFLKALCDCFGNDLIMNQLRSLKINKYFDVNQVSTELIFSKEVQNVIAAYSKIVKVLPFLNPDIDLLDDEDYVYGCAGE